jgi:hypothetical protein
MQCFHRLFNRCFVIESVDLEEVDVGGFQAVKGSVDGVENCLAGKA